MRHEIRTGVGRVLRSAVGLLQARTVSPVDLRFSPALLALHGATLDGTSKRNPARLALPTSEEPDAVLRKKLDMLARKLAAQA